MTSSHSVRIAVGASASSAAWRFSDGASRASPKTSISIILSGFGSETAYIDELCRTYSERVVDAAAFARRHRVLLLQSERGIPVDISLGALPFEERIIERATAYRFLAGIRLHTCSAEDLVVLKAFADRPRDWADIEGILIRNGSRLDWHTIETELPPLCEAKEAPHILPRLAALRHLHG